MATMYRCVSPFDGDIKTETKHATLRLPSNVPYVTDNEADTWTLRKLPG